MEIDLEKINVNHEKFEGLYRISIGNGSFVVLTAGQIWRFSWEYDRKKFLTEVTNIVEFCIKRDTTGLKKELVDKIKCARSTEVGHSRSIMERFKCLPLDEDGQAVDNEWSTPGFWDVDLDECSATAFWAMCEEIEDRTNDLTPSGQGAGFLPCSSELLALLAAQNSARTLPSPPSSDDGNLDDQIPMQFTLAPPSRTLLSPPSSDDGNQDDPMEADSDMD